MLVPKDNHGRRNMRSTAGFGTVAVALGLIRKTFPKAHGGWYDIC